MVNSSPANSNRDNSNLSKTQAELLQSVLSEEVYPWSPAEAAKHYEDELEEAGQALEVSDDEAVAGWKRLSTQLGEVWDDSNVDVLARLKQKFAARLPESVLATISDRACQSVQELSKAARPITAQMIDCVKGTVGKIGEADLQVMARPMAFAMRSNGVNESIDATVTSVRQAAWEKLSPLEQAKLSLAAARYAIAQFEGDV